MHTFRQAVETHDAARIEATLADDVVFTSPVAFKPYPGKAITAAILRGVLRVFEDFRYVREIVDANGGTLRWSSRPPSTESMSTAAISFT